jgi:hypothetical protein
MFEEQPCQNDSGIQAPDRTRDQQPGDKVLRDRGPFSITNTCATDVNA